MKLILNDHIQIKMGKCHDGKHVYFSKAGSDMAYMRRFTYPIVTQHNHDFGTRGTKIKALWQAVGAPFKEALRIYANAYNKQLKAKNKANISAYNVFVKALGNSIVETADLNSLPDVVTAHGATISSWITAGLLPDIRGMMSTATVI